MWRNGNRILWEYYRIEPPPPIRTYEILFWRSFCYSNFFLSVSVWCEYMWNSWILFFTPLTLDHFFGYASFHFSSSFVIQNFFLHIFFTFKEQCCFSSRFFICYRCLAMFGIIISYFFICCSLYRFKFYVFVDYI